MADPLLAVANLETYYGPIMAIRGISFTVPERSVVTILGANGAGKSTILKTVSGVMDPQKGTVTFAGREIHGMDPDRVTRLGISHVPEGREVFPFLSVRENLMMGAFTRKDAAGVAEDLELVYSYFPVLRSRAEQRAGSLSGGEQQMLAISRALMARPRMMLLDEPSLGLSPRLVKEIFEIITRINRERGVTVLLVEQNANMALHIADYGYVLEVGRIVMEDTCARLLEKDLGVWRAVSWRQYGERAKHVGLGLVALGLRHRDVVSVMADNCPEWLYTDMCTLSVGAVTNGLYTTHSPPQVQS